ncbi:hypothetical protein TNCV_1059181 [Trichonephila clavipes]|nr:hypothetical protein TNCV_1059181 [Trichonephila clavipes]
MIMKHIKEPLSTNMTLKMCYVPSEQEQAKSFCSYSPETLGARLGSFNSSTI